jgi:AcrR family transcriptional regulator
LSRPRKATDDDVFAAAYRVMQRVGPDELSLAAIAAEAGVTSAALVQRFGSRHALLVQLAEGAAAATPDFAQHFLAQEGSPLAALAEYALCFADMAKTPDAMARNLAYLHNDLTDPDLRKPLVVMAKHTQASLERLVRGAINAEELERRVPVAALVRALQALISGSLMSWAILRKGTARVWLRDDFMTLVGPHLTPKGRRSLRG